MGKGVAMSRHPFPVYAGIGFVFPPLSPSKLVSM